LINTGKVASFIDDIIVGMEEEEGYNEVIKKGWSKITYM